MIQYSTAYFKIIRRLLVLLILITIIIIPTAVLAQDSRDTTAAYKWFDGVVGVENSGLFNGIEYIEQHVSVNDKQKFLGSIYFTPGSVVLDGRPYYNVEMKYNVYDDLLLLRGPGSNPLQLPTSRVQEFSINGLSFINIPGDSTAAVHGFYQVFPEDGNLTLLKKHTKKLRKYLDRSFTYFEFEEDTPRYAIAFNGKFYLVNSRREVIRAFPHLAGEIRQIYRDEGSKLKTNPDLFMTGLSKKLSQMSSSNIFPE